MNGVLNGRWESLLPTAVEAARYGFRREQVRDTKPATIPVVLASGDHDVPGRVRDLDIRHWLYKPDALIALVMRRSVVWSGGFTTPATLQRADGQRYDA